MAPINVKLYTVKGEEKGTVELPPPFEAPFRPDLIRKTVNAILSNARQPYGSDPLAGAKHSQYSWRSGQGSSRVPRLSQGSRAVLSPAVVGGRRAHPPKVATNWSEKVNRKERKLALASALGATTRADLVSARGHKFREGVTLPVIVEDAFASLEKTAKVREALAALGLDADLERASNGRHQRAGRGKLRGRRNRTPRSVLVVVEADAPVRRAAVNLPGVEVVSVSELNCDRVAPGGDAGRLAVFTAGALREIQARSEDSA
ncbi:MAG: 50S ribosomal protein L4 [Thermoplasmatota archaeon]